MFSELLKKGCIILATGCCCWGGGYIIFILFIQHYDMYCTNIYAELALDDRDVGHPK